MKNKYKQFGDKLFSKIKKDIQNGEKQSGEDHIKFLNDLPTNLRNDLSIIMHKDLLKGIKIF